MQWLLAPEPHNVLVEAKVVEDLILSAAYHAAENKQTWLRRALIVAPDAVERIAAATIGQRQNP